MSTFNAGAIEANLTLGRSSWTKDLRLTKKEIADLEKTAITIGIDADADNALIQMSNVEALAEDFDGETYAATLDLDAAQANATLDALDARLDALDNRIVTFMIDGDADNAYVAISNLEAFLEDLDSETYSPKVDLITRDAEAALAALRAELDILDARTVTVMVDADTDNAHVGISLLEADLDYLDTETVTIGIDVDATQAQTELIQIGSFVNALDNSDIDIGVDINGFAKGVTQMNILQAQVDMLDGQDIDLSVDVDRKALNDLVGSPSGGSSGGGGYLGIFRILLYSVIALLPILAVASGAATAGIVGLAGALAAAAGPAIVLGAGIFGLTQRFKEAQESGDPLSDSMQMLADALDRLDEVWNEFLDNIEVQGFSLMAQAVNTLAMVIPALAPLFNATAEAMSGVLGSLQDWINSPEFDEMIDFFSGFGVDMLVAWLDIAGDLIVFFGNLFDAMAPFIRQMIGGLQEVTQGWVDWARNLDTNESFQQWVERAMEYGPMLFDLLGSIGSALANIGEALEPFAGPMITGFINFFDFIANLDPNLLGGLIAGFAGLYLGAKILLPIISGILAILPVLGGVATFLGGPLLIAAGAVAALATAFVFAYNESERMQRILRNTWNLIKETVAPIVEDIKTVIMENIGPLSDWWDETWGHIKGVLREAMNIIRIVVRNTTDVIKRIWNTFGDNIIQIVEGFMRIIGGIIKGGFRIIKGIFQVIGGILTGDWKKVWTGIKNILGGAVDALKGILIGALQIWGNVFDAIGKALIGSWRWAMDGLRNTWNSFRDWIGERWAALRSWFSNLTISPGAIWDGIREGFRDMMNTIIGWWNNFGIYLDLPDKIPGMPDSISIQTPNINYLAKGAYVDEAMLAVVGEGSEPEVVAPESKMMDMAMAAARNSGTDIDYNRMAAAVAAALATVMQQFGGSGLTREDLMDFLAAGAINLKVDATQDTDTLAKRIVGGLGFELRRLGFGGVANV